MSSGDPSKEIIPGQPHSHPSLSAHQHQQLQQQLHTNGIERHSTMSVGYLTRTPHNRELHSYEIPNTSNFIYSQPLMSQPNMPQPSQRGDVYERPPSGLAHSGSAQNATSATASSHSSQPSRITLPPLSAITDNQENQAGQEALGSGQASQPAPMSPSQTYTSSQQQQQSHPTQQQPQSNSSASQSSQSSQPYPPRPVSQYDPQQGAYPHPSRHLQPSPQLAADQSRYPSGPMMPQQVSVPPHQMPVQSLQQNPQIGQFPSPSPTPTHFQPQSQYSYPQPQYPPQPLYGQYPPPPPQLGQLPPGIPYQPAYATSHRQRPPQFNPYPPPNSFVPPPPQGATPSWPQADYVAQPLTPLTAHSPQQGYSPQVPQMPGQSGPMRIRRTSSGLSQSPYPPPPGEAGPPPGSQQGGIKPKRKRASSDQLRVLNNVFASTFFPSTELRIALGKELNMSPRTVQIWFQNKRQSWRANKAKSDQQNASAGNAAGGQPAIATGGPGGSGAFSPHPLRQEHFAGAGTPTHGRMPSSAAEEIAREEGMENDEGGGWEALRQAQANRPYRSGAPGHDQDDEIGFDDDGTGMDSPHHRHR